MKSREASSPPHESTSQQSAIVVEYELEQDLPSTATELRPSSLEVTTAVMEESHEADYSNLARRETNPPSAYIALIAPIAAMSSSTSVSEDNEEMMEMSHTYYNIQIDLQSESNSPV